MSATASTRHSTRGAYLALGLGILCIGLSAIWVKLAGVPGVVSGFYRVFLAAIILVPLWLINHPKLPGRRALTFTLLGGVFFALDLALWNSAILLTSAALATLLANNAPLWVGLGAMIFFRERLSTAYWVGLFLSLAGMALVARPMNGGALNFDIGSLMAIAASFLYAAYLLTTQRVRASVDTVTFMTLAVVSSTVVLAVICLAMDAPLVGYPLQSWLALLGLALVSQVGGWLSINYALGHLPATRVSVSLLGQVVVTTLIAIPLFGEIPTAIQIVGAALVLAGIYTVQQAREGQVQSVELTIDN